MDENGEVGHDVQAPDGELDGSRVDRMQEWGCYDVKFWVPRHPPRTFRSRITGSSEGKSSCYKTQHRCVAIDRASI